MDNSNPVIFSTGECNTSSIYGSVTSFDILELAISIDPPSMYFHSLANIVQSRITPEEVFECIRHIKDPEHPDVSLEQLRVVSLEQIQVFYHPLSEDDLANSYSHHNIVSHSHASNTAFSINSLYERENSYPIRSEPRLRYITPYYIVVEFTPTVPTCSVAAMIGLGLSAKLSICFPGARICIIVEKGTHDQEESVNQQLSDKERCEAALENPSLSEMARKTFIDTDNPLPSKHSMKEWYSSMFHEGNR